jgi:hypothetical protein
MGHALLLDPTERTPSTNLESSRRTVHRENSAHDVPTDTPLRKFRKLEHWLKVGKCPSLPYNPKKRGYVLTNLSRKTVTNHHNRH